MQRGKERNSTVVPAPAGMTSYEQAAFHIGLWVQVHHLLKRNGNWGTGVWGAFPPIWLCSSAQSRGIQAYLASQI